MVPVLYDSTSFSVEDSRIGSLVDCTRCQVTEQKNGKYELFMEYHVGGQYAEKIKLGYIIEAIPSPYRAPQYFRIYRVSRAIDGIVKYYARHVAFDAYYSIVFPFAAQSAEGAMALLSQHEWTHLKYHTDIVSNKPYDVDTVCNAQQVVGSGEGSLLDVYGGVWDYDNFNVYLRKSRGSDRGARISYGGNLTGYTYEHNVANEITDICPIYKSGVHIVFTSPQIMNVLPNPDFQNIQVVDLTSRFGTAPDPNELEAVARQYIAENELDKPKIDLKASFIQLDKAVNPVPSEPIDLCDTVHVQIEKGGPVVDSEIVQIVTDVLDERYMSVSIGTIHDSIADTIARQQQEINRLNRR